MNSEMNIKRRRLSSIKKVIALIATLCILSIIFFPTESGHFLLRNVLHLLLFFDKQANYITYTELSQVGNRSSVPYLIKELQKYPSDSRGDQEMRSLLISGLHRITNNHPGDKYKDWGKWWEANKTKSTEDWIILSLKPEGYNVSGYPDDTSLSEIINAMAFKEPVQKEYFLRNISRLILKQPTNKIIKLIKKKLEHDQSFDSQLGSARALEAIGTYATLPLLKLLAANHNQDIKSVALGALNSVLRKKYKEQRNPDVTHTAINVGKYIDNISIMPDYNSLLVVKTTVMDGSRISTITKIDIKNGKFVWTYNCPAEVGSELITHNNNILYYAYGGTVNCIDAVTGKFKWQAKTEGTTYRFESKVITVGDTVFAAPKDYVWAFDIKTGEVKWKLKVKPSSGRIIYSSDNIFVATRENKLLKISLRGELLAKADIGGWPYSLETYDNIIYVTYKSEPVYLRAFSSKNLRPLFKAFIGDKFYISSIVGINDKVVILSYSRWIKAFDRGNGLQIWAVNEKDSFTLKMNSGVITVNDELRNSTSGETLYKYNIDVDSLWNSFLFGQFCTFSTNSGKLHVFSIPSIK